MENSQPSSGGIGKVLTVIVALALGAGVVVYRGIQMRTSAASVAREATASFAVPTVSVLHPTLGDANNEIVLSGAIQAYTDAPIYTRASGYVKSWHADLGDRVKAGQVLAEIDAPEVDQQVNQAKANLQQAQAALAQTEANLLQSRANEGLAKLTADRWSQLSKEGIVAQQDNDQRQAQYQAQKANTQALEKAVAAARGNIAAVESNIAMLDQVQSYRTIRAPFDGVVTARKTDIGALVSGGNVATAAELFHISATDRLRVFVNVPEVYSRNAVTGAVATMTLEEFPNRRFQAKLVRTSGALDSDTRTLLTEFEIDNRAGTLRPGAYAEVHLKVDHSTRALLVPVSAVLYRSEGPQIGLVGKDMKASLVSVALGKDFGSQLEIVSGISENDSVIVAPPDSLVSGMEVRVVTSGGNSKQTAP